MFSRDNSQALSPLAKFWLMEKVIQSVEMSYNADLWTNNNLKTMRLKVGLISFYRLNGGLCFPKLGKSTFISGKCNILTIFEIHSCV